MLIDVKVPVLAESVDEATLINWHKQVGEPVQHGDNLIDIETDKVTLEVVALQDGVLVEIIKKDGETVKSDEVIARIDPQADTEGATASKGQQTLPEIEPKIEAVKKPKKQLKLSPAVRNMLKEHKLDAEEITAQSNSGRITKEDVLRFLENKQLKEQTTESTSSTSAVTTPALTENDKGKAQTETAGMTTDKARTEERVPMTRLRKKIAERLLAAQQKNAILTTFNEVNMQAIMTIRDRYKGHFEQSHDVKLGFMSFFTKAATAALKKFPIINAAVSGDDIIYHGYFDIGIAVSSPRGLVVPIVQDTDLLSLADIEIKIREYGEKARNGQLTLDELSGGTFTITNGGVFGSLLSTPIINPPQSAILGMHTIQQRPVAENDAVVIRPMMYLALSYDHRIIDGREAVQFLVCIKEQLEDPVRLLLQL